MAADKSTGHVNHNEGFTLRAGQARSRVSVNEVLTIRVGTGTSVKQTAFLVVMMTFFASLALDISVPALVLSLMALSNHIVLNGPPTRRFREKTA